MDKDDVNTKLDARYVDDGRTLMYPIKAGWKWSEGESRMAGVRSRRQISP